jgi:DNA integrity scanning protein DisA with diadenylate cyclase activity
LVIYQNYTKMRGQQNIKFIVLYLCLLIFIILSFMIHLTTASRNILHTAKVIHAKAVHILIPFFLNSKSKILHRICYSTIVGKTPLNVKRDEVSVYYIKDASQL